MTTVARLEEHIPSLRRYAWSLSRSGVEADDLVQDCLMRAIERIRTLRTEDGLRPWLFAIMHNLHVNTWRRHRTRAHVIVEGLDADGAVAASQTATAEMRAVLRSLADLSEEQRSVLVLIAVEGFQYAEVAKILDIPLGTVMSRLSRARDRLRELVEGTERPASRRAG